MRSEAAGVEGWQGLPVLSAACVQPHGSVNVRVALRLSGLDGHLLTELDFPLP